MLNLLISFLNLGNQDLPAEKIVDVKDNQWLGVTLARQTNRDKNGDVSVSRFSLLLNCGIFNTLWANPVHIGHWIFTCVCQGLKLTLLLCVQNCAICNTLWGNPVHIGHWIFTCVCQGLKFTLLLCVQNCAINNTLWGNPVHIGQWRFT